MDYAARKQKIIEYLKLYGVITNKEVQALTGCHRNTVSSDFKLLINEGVLEAQGGKKGTVYRLLEDQIFSSAMIRSIVSDADKRGLDRYLATTSRKKIFFNQTFERALGADFSYATDITKNFMDHKSKLEAKRRALADEERKRRKERLVIDLSWASANIEGNTYSILETESLLKYNETAKGRSLEEAHMILNHKTAIEYIREDSVYRTISKQKVLELHSILVRDLGVGTGFREHLVAISNSSFVPADNRFQIISFFDEMILTVNSMSFPLEKAVAVNLLLAYLQPFSDGNKRTSRMLGNAVLLAHGFLPISFVRTAKEDYIKAMIYFYERQDPKFFKQIFLQELNNSFKDYIG